MATAVGFRFGKRYCQPCAEKMLQGWKRAAAREGELDRRYRREYGIGIIEVGALYEQQAGRCAICKNPERLGDDGELKLLAVDHDHDTGRVRGLLCASCNMALGLFSDDMRNLASAITYLANAQERERLRADDTDDQSGRRGVRSDSEEGGAAS